METCALFELLKKKHAECPESAINAIKVLERYPENEWFAPPSDELGENQAINYYLSSMGREGVIATCCVPLYDKNKEFVCWDVRYQYNKNLRYFYKQSNK